MIRNLIWIRLEPVDFQFCSTATFLCIGQLVLWNCIPDLDVNSLYRRTWVAAPGGWGGGKEAPSHRKLEPPTSSTRRYPWGIQYLVSTHPNGERGAVFLGSQNSKCQVLANFYFRGGGGGSWGYSWVVKTQSAKFWPIFIFREGEGGILG